MGSLPPEKAGIGSAVNDTVREVGGALGVAVLGSILASQYTSAVGPATEGLPPAGAETAGDSLGGAVVVAQQAGGSAGAALLDAARTAWVDGFSLALMVAAGVAAAGALVAAIWLPARSADAVEPETEVDQDALELIAA
jgi:hypothetical protein